jgi:uncharacterized integral membrane protein
MKPSWFFVLFLLVLVAVFSVQNAAVITVKFLVWDFTLSAALVVMLSAFLGALIGLIVGALSRRRPKPAPSVPTPSIEPRKTP